LTPNYDLATLNVGEFQRVYGLRLVDIFGYALPVRQELEAIVPETDSDTILTLQSLVRVFPAVAALAMLLTVG
jgi:hypothetical protein